MRTVIVSTGRPEDPAETEEWERAKALGDRKDLPMSDSTTTDTDPWAAAGRWMGRYADLRIEHDALVAEVGRLHSECRYWKLRFSGVDEDTAHEVSGWPPELWAKP